MIRRTVRIVMLRVPRLSLESKLQFRRPISSVSFDTKIITKNALKNYEALLNSPEITQAIEPISVNRLGQGHHLQELITQYKLNSKNPILTDLILNAIIIEISSNSTYQLSKDLMVQLADSIASNKLNFRTFLNYQVLTSIIFESESFMRNLSVYSAYRIFYRPFIQNLRNDNYLMKSENMKDVLEHFKGSLENETDVSFKRLVYSDLVDTINDSIFHEDHETTTLLIGQLKRHYEYPLTEDYHTFLSTAIENSNLKVLKELITGDLFKFAPDISDSERQLACLAFASTGEASSLAHIWNSNKPLQSFELSLLVEVFHEALGVKDSIKLIELLSPLLDDEINLVDFNFLVYVIKSRIEANSISRKEFQPKDPTSLRRPKKLSIQRIEIKTTLNELGILKLDNHELSVFSVNLFVKAVSDLTNLSGVLYAYSLIPSNKISRDLFEILSHSASKADDAPARTFELFKTFYSTDKELISIRSYEFLIESAIKQRNEKLLSLYLHKYSTTYPSHPLTSRMMHTLKHQRYGWITEALLHPEGISKYLPNFINTDDDSISSLDTFRPESGSQFDKKDTEILQRLHTSK